MRHLLALALLASSGLALSATTTRVSVFLVTDGRPGLATFGCGDSLVREPRAVPATSAPLRAALNALVVARSSGGRRNVFVGSALRVGRIELRDRRAVVYLEGRLTLNGVCDAPRVLAQLNATATQFPTVRDACFFLNGEPLEAALSESGLPVARDVCTGRPRR